MPRTPSAMTRDVAHLIVAARAPLREALAAIGRDVLGMALVADDDGRLSGVCTDGDARRALLAGKTLDTPVAEVATAACVSAALDTPVEALLALVNERVRHVPLVDEERRPRAIFSYEQRFRVPVAEPALGATERAHVLACLDSGWISSGGPFVRRFEEEFARRLGVRHAIAVSSGTMGLQVALAALGLGPGDEVIVPTLTFAATAATVVHAGARPVLVDCDLATWNMDPALVARAVTPRTRAIVPVHLYGLPCDLDALGAIARRHGLLLLEDAAEALGADWRDRPAGCWGDAGVFSFFGNKLLTTGEGGMVVTDRPALADRLRRLRDHGMNPARRYWHEEVGFNARLTNLQAAVGVAQLEKFEALRAAKRRLADGYRARLGAGLGLCFQREAAPARSAWWMTSVVCTAGPDAREALRRRLAAHAIETRPLFYPLHRMPPYGPERCGPVVTDGGPEGAPTVADWLSDRGLTLPSATTLADEELDRIAALLRG